MEDCDYWFAPSPHHQYFTSLLEEFQLEQLAVETFPVEVSFSLSFLLLLLTQFFSILFLLLGQYLHLPLVLHELFLLLSDLLFI